MGEWNRREAETRGEGDGESAKMQGRETGESEQRMERLKILLDFPVVIQNRKEEKIDDSLRLGLRRRDSAESKFVLLIVI